MKVSIFAQQGFYTNLHNALFDVVLPSVPPNAWKVLCAIIRQTKGWNRDMVGLSVPQIMRLTGIGSAHTIQKALIALQGFSQSGENKPLIVATQNDKWEKRFYGLNRKVKLDWIPVAESVSEPDAETASEPHAETASEPHAETASEPHAETASEPHAETASHVRKEEINHKEKSSSSRKKERSSPESVAAAASKSLNGLPKSRHGLLVIEQFIEETRETAKNPKGLARAVWQNGEDDELINRWLDQKFAWAKESERRSEMEAERLAELECNHQAAIAREEALRDFIENLSAEDYKARFALAHKIVKAQMNKGRKLYQQIEPDKDSIEYRMFTIFEAESAESETAQKAA